MTLKTAIIDGGRLQIYFTWGFGKKIYQCLDCAEKVGKVRVKVSEIKSDQRPIAKDTDLGKKAVQLINREMRHGWPLCIKHWVNSYGSFL
jgi:hypothetical protein